MQEPSDTSPAVQRLIDEGLRRMPVWRKLELVGQMNRMVDALALGGLRQRHPQATEAELRRRLADLRLGSELDRRVYGPIESGKGR
jgi:hypothetical protein